MQKLIMFHEDCEVLYHLVNSSDKNFDIGEPSAKNGS